MSDQPGVEVAQKSGEAIQPGTIVGAGILGLHQRFERAPRVRTGGVDQNLEMLGELRGGGSSGACRWFAVGGQRPVASGGEEVTQLFDVAVGLGELFGKWILRHEVRAPFSFNRNSS